MLLHDYRPSEMVTRLMARFVQLVVGTTTGGGGTESCSRLQSNVGTEFRELG
jgi:hypothetical protein